MVKKNYFAPASLEVRTRLRTTLLAGSSNDPFSANQIQGIENGEKAATDKRDIVPARERSASSLD